MNRQQRRASRKRIESMVKGVPNLDNRAVMGMMVARMAEVGPSLVALMTERAEGKYPGRAYTQNEAAHGMMGAVRALEYAMVEGDGKGFVDHAAAVLFFARDIAIQEQIVKPNVSVAGNA